MSDVILDQIDEAAEHSEEILLAEFVRICQESSAESHLPIEPGIRDDVDAAVNKLWHDLEHSGDLINLSLRTDRHEAVAARLIVLKKLLDARIPIASLEAAHQEIIRSRAELERFVRTARGAGKNPPTDDIRDIFGGKRGAQDLARNRLKISGEEEKQAGVVYPDKGVYSASRELAFIAARFETAGDDRELMEAAVRGKATFESQELSAEALRAIEASRPQASSAGPSTFASRDLSTPRAPDPQPGTTARTPDAIRKKLEQSDAGSSVASRFAARELSSSTPPSKPSREPVKKEASAEIAHTPEEIRRKLQARQSQVSSGRAAFSSKDIEPVAPQPAPVERPTGRAAFTSKDIEPIAPQEAPRKRDDPKPKVEERPTGKAVFESRDLSDAPAKKD